MQRQFRRFILALGVSLAGFFGTMIWYHLTRADFGAHRSSKPLAQLNEAQNEVQRKPVHRVIWESVTKNDELFTGEAIRTAPDAEASLFFIKTGTTVHLDPDSLIVLEENDKGLSLDFLQGNVFVQSAKNSGEELTLKTGDKKIKLKSADLSLSKGQNGKVDLEVHRGSAELEQGDKKTPLDKTHSAQVSDEGVDIRDQALEVAHPAAGETLFLNLSKGDKLQVEWKALAPEYDVTVELGAARAKLGLLKGVTASGASGHLAFESKLGRFYLRLKAVSRIDAKKTMLSAVVPFIVQPKAAPSLLEPRQDASVVPTEPDAPTGFRWLNRGHFSSQALEIAADAQFRNVKTRKDLDAEAANFTAPLADGTYYWRVTGFLRKSGKVESLSSAINKFSVRSHLDMKAPLAIYPKSGQHLGQGEIASGLVLRWQSPNEKVEAELEIEREGHWQAFAKDTRETSELRVTNVKAGKYRWRARALDGEGNPGKVSDDVAFTIENLPRLDWVDPALEIESQYSGKTPSLNAGWMKFAGATSYRYRVGEGEWINNSGTSARIPVETDGSYAVVVEALNEKGGAIAQSESKTFHVSKLPLLPAPRWASRMPPAFKSDGKGNLTLNWEKVDGASSYMMVLQSLDGKVISQKTVSRTTAALQKLKPGAYNVSLQSVDDAKRPGLEGEKRALNVPNTSDIRAPKFKTMKVK